MREIKEILEEMLSAQASSVGLKELQTWGIELSLGLINLGQKTAKAETEFRKLSGKQERFNTKEYQRWRDLRLLHNDLEKLLSIIKILLR